MIILFSYHYFSLRYLKSFSHELFSRFLKCRLGKYGQLPVIALSLDTEIGHYGKSFDKHYVHDMKASLLKSSC